MCGPFKGLKGILRLLEIILSALTLVIVLCRGPMASPWGVWCLFVWFFCAAVAAALTLVEALSLQVLLAAFLPDWADLVCGLTVLCAAMVASATAAFAAVFVCLPCVVNILCFLTSLAATGAFAVASGRLPDRAAGGGLRMAEAFTACVILTAAADHSVSGGYPHYPAGMTCAAIAVAACLLGTVAVVVLHLLKLLQCLVAFQLGLVEVAFNAAAVLLYLLAVLLWCLFGYGRRGYGPYACAGCSLVDVNAVTVGAAVNVVLYVVDLVLSIKSR